MISSWNILPKTVLIFFLFVFARYDINAQINCQQIIPIINTSSVTETIEIDPNTNKEVRYFDLCQGDVLSLSADATFPENNSTYTQSIEKTSFTWYINNESLYETLNFSHQFNVPGGYIIFLKATDDENCEAATPDQVFVRVSIPPIIDLSVSPSTVCPETKKTVGSSTFADINFSKNIQNTLWESPPCEDEFSDALYLPDGNGAIYSTDINIECFENNQILNDVNNIISVNVNMEHSYSGDLDIYLKAPNGVEIVLFEQTGSSIWFGEASDDDDSETNPGIGYNYGWSMNPTYNGTMSDGFEDNIVTFIDNPEKTLKEDIYLPIGNFSAFIGSPLNGTWTLSIRDNLTRDNGWIFSWGINFDKTLALPSWSFQNEITSEYFLSGATVVENFMDSIIIEPKPGVQSYNYEVVDNFGCKYQEDFSITANAITVEEQITDEFCENGKGEVNLEISGGTPHYSIDWNTGDTGKTLSNLSENTYYYTIKDALNCSYVGNIEIENNKMGLNFDVEVKDDHCKQGIGEILISPRNGVAPYNYNWYNSSINNNQLKKLKRGYYLVNIMDDLGCTGELEMEVSDAQEPEAFFEVSSDTVAYENGIVEFFNKTISPYDIVNSQWDIDGSTFSTEFETSYDFDEMGTYEINLKVTDSYGCSDQFKKEIVATENYFFWLPTAFTPNGDNMNDYFLPIIDRVIESSYELYIYDIWGKLIYQTSNIRQGWNGKRENDEEITRTTTYYYKVRFKSLLNEWHEKEGSFVLLK